MYWPAGFSPGLAVNRLFFRPRSGNFRPHRGVPLVKSPFMKDVVREYSNGEVTIVWKPALCIHSEKCVKGLPQVFRPQEQPWIEAEAAPTDALVAQVKQCPSGALSYYFNQAGRNETEGEAEPLECDVLPNGPLIVKGKVKVNLPDGKVVERSQRTAFCRCGASRNKPFCDGSHTEIGFLD